MNKINGLWIVETRKQKFKGGGSSETTEKVRVLARENGMQIIEAVVLTDTDIDSSGNTTVDTGKGYHYVSLMKGKNQLSFAIDFTKARLGWRVLSNNCLSFVQDVKTKKAAIKLLVTASKAELTREDAQ